MNIFLAMNLKAFWRLSKVIYSSSSKITDNLMCFIMSEKVSNNYAINTIAVWLTNSTPVCDYFMIIAHLSGFESRIQLFLIIKIFSKAIHNLPQTQRLLDTIAQISLAREHNIHIWYDHTYQPQICLYTILTTDASAHINLGI